MQNIIGSQKVLYVKIEGTEGKSFLVTDQTFLQYSHLLEEVKIDKNLTLVVFYREAILEELQRLQEEEN